MVVKVLVVDDSNFFRRRVSEMINNSPSLEVIATANNGQEAVDMVAKYKPDVVTMDIEMPVMDGITAVKKIMATNPLPILMFSSLTHQGASATLDALEAGAADFLPKKFEDIARDKNDAICLLQQRILAISRLSLPRIITQNQTRLQVKTTSTRLPLTTSRHPLVAAKVVTSAPSRFFKASGKHYSILAIGTSTGGPVALQKVLSALPANFKLPILLIQHMPGTFTKAFAERLNGICKIKVKEASNGDLLQAGCAYLAPGGKQLLVEGRCGNVRIRIHDGNEQLNYKPSVDITFASLSKIYTNKVLAVILTGMGADGRDGARMLKEKGSVIWAQDEASCVVYGMPQAVYKAGIATESIALDQVARYIKVELQHE
ncbi:protein-glutamate methylesterase/protein-glutamine glutaminase [Psychromonas sp. CD1]|uniref:protein-glutamate methylesterase/protein-glutamine glutaminase n=1 Tax=Psychromonas sp. CD1 TaxID=1979839 RepID=UPI000B9C1536|nr:chemotaxis response regulator protein-glutamate methylesterase [Psychromonas sp. CD1]